MVEEMAAFLDQCVLRTDYSRRPSTEINKLRAVFDKEAQLIGRAGDTIENRFVGVVWVSDEKRADEIANEKIAV
jgi:hypothetical protein